MIDPEHYFPGQQASEKVFLFIRRHPLVMLPEVIIAGVGFLLPIGIIIALAAGRRSAPEPEAEIPPPHSPHRSTPASWFRGPPPAG